MSFLEHRGAFWIAAPLVGTLGCSLRQESTRMLYADQSLSSHTAEDLPRMAVCDEPPKPFHLTHCSIFYSSAILRLVTDAGANS